MKPIICKCGYRFTKKALQERLINLNVHKPFHTIIRGREDFVCPDCGHLTVVSYSGNVQINLKTMKKYIPRMVTKKEKKNEEE